MKRISVFFAIRAASSIGGSCAFGVSSIPQPSAATAKAFATTTTTQRRFLGTSAAAAASSFQSIPRGGGFSTSSNSAATTTTSTTARTMSSTKLASEMTRAEKALAITGLPMGPYPIGVKTVQIDGDPKRGRGLQTEFWYPSTDASLEMPTTKYSEYLGLDTAADPKAALATANAGNAIGGYRDGISIEELDDPKRSTWMTNAVRNAPVRSADGKKWPLVVFSHGSGAYRASYSFWTEFLASHGFVVAACDHPGSARYTIVDGKVLRPISNRAQNEANRPLDIVQILDGVEQGSDDELFQKTDATNAAVTGMSFGGFTTAATLELQDPRVKAAVMMSGSMEMSGTRDYHTPARKNKSTPVLIMIGTEDTVLGDAANEANREYGKHHTDGDVYLVEIVRGGHVSFTSCEMYDPEYGNGINASGQSKSLTTPGGLYTPLPIQDQHEVINSYGLKFLNKYLKDTDDEGYLEKNHFDDKEILYKSFAKK